jgi:alkylation response protein AidB-like acyl-CoA dehydrogenase
VADTAVRAAASQTRLFCAAARFGANKADEGKVPPASLLAGEAAVYDARANSQILGTMGFAAESDAHWLLRAARVIATSGSSRRHEGIAVLRPRSSGPEIQS